MQELLRCEGFVYTAAADGAFAPGAPTRRLPSDGSMTWSTYVPLQHSCDKLACMDVTCLHACNIFGIAMC